MSDQLNLRSLDALRGLLACYVLAGHARWLLWAGWDAWSHASHSTADHLMAMASACFRYGHEAVVVFFVLSGFFIHLGAARRFATGSLDGTRPSIAAFFQRRFRRLAPPYAFALLVTLAADFFGRWLYPALYSGRTGDTLLDITFARTGYGVAATIPALVMLPDSLGRTFGSNGPLWSLAYEVLYYLFYPGWLLLRKQSAWLAYGPAVLLLAGSSWLASDGTFLGSVVAHYPLWLAGAALAEFVCSRRLRGNLALLLTQVALGVGALAVSSRLYLGLAQLGLYVIGGGAFVLAFAGMSAGLSDNLLVRMAEWLGLRSYTIYICHFPLLVLTSALTFHLLGHRPMSGWVALGGGTTILLCSAAFFVVCERPFLRPARVRHVISNDA